LNLVFRHRRDVGRFERRNDCDQPVQCGQPHRLGGEEIHEILDFAQPFGRQGPNLLGHVLSVPHALCRPALLP
jgi:hypothetical protein